MRWTIGAGFAIMNAPDQGGITMKLSDKLIELRKARGWSQEEFAEKMDVSRQAISRWENGTALPDAQNILRISKLFSVTSDYLLNDDYEGEANTPAPETVAEETVVNETPEETASSAQNKKHPYWILIPVICFLLLAFGVIIKIVHGLDNPTSEIHAHPVLSTVKENEIASTCTAEGSYDEVIYCADCDKEILRTTKSVAKLAHTLSSSVKENEVAPTCTAEGSYDEVVYCMECNETVLRTNRRTEKIAHQFQNRKCIVCEVAQPSEGLLYMSNGNGTCFVSCGDCADEDIVIPDYSPIGEEVTQIKAFAFAGNKRVKSVRMPETVTKIGEGAFQDCSNLEDVNLPSKITMIQPYTFDGCEKLKEVKIPSDVYYIGVEAFADCCACESIVIPAKVTKIGKFAFRNFSKCEGTVTFERYDGWRLYDDSDNWVDTVDFQNGMGTPAFYLTFLRSEYTWKRS